MNILTGFSPCLQNLKKRIALYKNQSCSVQLWWKDEAEKYGVQFDQHDDGYARTEEWQTVLNNVWQKK